MHRLADARLVTTSGEGDVRVEVAHEALIRAWPRLRGWIDVSRDDLRTRQRISRAASEWDDGAGDGSLWRGALLATALEWAASHTGELNERETAFLRASRADEDAQSRRRRRRLAGVLVSLSMLTVIALVLVVIAVAAARRASQQEHVATEQAAIASAQALAARSRTLRTVNPALAVVLAAEAVTATDPPISESMNALVSARVAFGETRVAAGR